LTHLLQGADGVCQVVVGEPARDAVRPLDLTGGDVVQHGASSRREYRKLCSLVSRIVAIRHESVSLEQVGDALHALTGQSHPAADVRDRSFILIQRAEDLPSSARLLRGTRQCVAGGQKASVQAEDFQNQRGEGVTGLGVMH
jgi:hypothetical protein